MKRAFGTTGLEVSLLGFGAGHVGGDDLSEDQAGTLLNAVLDLGVTLIDTARGYGQSEERIGRHLAHRRDDFVLSTKGGYGVDGVQDWTGEVIRRGIEQALRTMRTDRIDIFHLHSCPLETLRHEDILSALEEAKRQGQIRCIAYSGENDALEWAAGSGRFDSVQCSVNLFDQRALWGVLPGARGLGVIAKRPIANAAWQFGDQPHGQYAEAYWRRMKAMNLGPNIDWLELAIRFSAFAPGVSSIIVGTGKLQHFKHNLELLARGPLPDAEVQRWRSAFEAHDQGWIGQV
jgi:aryl-alcohol dehydrogenase-like predicted oxidoreductase